MTEGRDQAMFTVAADGEEVVDEIATYQQSRYLGSMEAAWRRLSYPVHEHIPAVEALPVHLYDADQPVRFHADDQLQQLVERREETKLTAFFKLCAEDELAATLLYRTVPRYYTWQLSPRIWRGGGEEHPTRTWPASS